MFYVFLPIVLGTLVFFNFIFGVLCYFFWPFTGLLIISNIGERMSKSLLMFNNNGPICYFNISLVKQISKANHLPPILMHDVCT